MPTTRSADDRELSRVRILKAAACGELPFRLCRQVFAGPFCISERIDMRDMHNRMGVEAVDSALCAVGMTPIGAFQEPPPLTPIAQIDAMRRRRKDERACIKHLRQCARIVFWVGWNFGEGDMPGRAHERRKLLVRHRRRIDPESVYRDTMDGRLFGVMSVRSHAEHTAGNPGHAGQRRFYLLRGGISRV